MSASQKPQIHVWGYPSGCPACDTLKELLEAHGVSYWFHHLHPSCHQRELLRGAGFATVPQVFDLDGNWLGDLNEIKRKISL